MEAERSLIKSNKVAIPFPHPRPTKDAQYKLVYSKPKSINVIGGYPLKVATRTGEELVMDLLVTMPEVKLYILILTRRLTFVDSLPRKGLSQLQILPQKSVLYRLCSSWNQAVVQAEVSSRVRAYAR